MARVLGMALDCRSCAVARTTPIATVRVDINGAQTQSAFDHVVKDLARNAPPVPGFRKAKGGKTSNVSVHVLLQLMGPGRVRKFVVDEILKSTLRDYVEKEGIKVKMDLKTDESREELDNLFKPGEPFGFSATLELEEEVEKVKDDANKDVTEQVPA